MILEDFLRDARNEITILGTNPLHPLLEESAAFLADLMNVNRGLRLVVLYESDSENFSQSLLLDTDPDADRVSYSTLSLHRDRISGAGINRKGEGLLGDIREVAEARNAWDSISTRIVLRQVNLRYPANMIVADGIMWTCDITHCRPTLDSYKRVEPHDPRHGELSAFIVFLRDHAKAGIYLSGPKDELIELYDMDSYPRGIFPRAAFYTTKFQRQSIWGLIFNRKGELLLHQRSRNTKDNRLLWDKSIGGHVDLRDTSTSVTARRELVEELFLPEAEYTKYVRPDLGDIVDFGEWNPKKRIERHFRDAFAGLGETDWILFRATDSDTGAPLTVRRISPRRYEATDEKMEVRRTRFMSDVYLIVAPSEYLDTRDQMKKLMSQAEKTGAAEDHKLVTVEGLRRWIEDEEARGTSEATFTDDLLYINLELRGLLERFAALVNYVYR